MTEQSMTLREGYTTGACAAAAAKAATAALIERQVINSIVITLPCGKDAAFVLARCDIYADHAICSVIKDAGDDPDCTHGAEITALVRLQDHPSITITGGQGVAIVTKTGLGLTVGSHAINPVPHKNITDMVRAELARSPYKGAQVVISVPDGEQRAEQTINARLGLVGGISILGTTGIVKPFSAAAYRCAILTAVKVACAAENDTLCFTTGGRSEAYAMQHYADMPAVAFIQVGDHMGTALTYGAQHHCCKIILALMLGKLSKLAAGQLATHVDDAAIDINFLGALAEQLGIAQPKLVALRAAITVRALLDILDKEEIMQISRLLCQRAHEHCVRHIHRAYDIEILLFDFDGNIITAWPHETNATLMESINGRT